MILYRYFETEEYANALCNGEVWLTTLEICRTHAPPRRDPDEAHLDYTHDPIEGSGDDESVRTVANRLGIRVGEGVKLSLSGNRSRNSIRDGYVLCCSVERSPALRGKFGDFCVQIAGGRHLYWMVRDALAEQASLTWSHAQRVIYAERRYHHLGDPPGRTGFVKPPRVEKTKYEDEREYRMLWVPRAQTGLTRMRLDLPKVAALCRRVAPI